MSRGAAQHEAERLWDAVGEIALGCNGADTGRTDDAAPVQRRNPPVIQGGVEQLAARLKHYGALAGTSELVHDSGVDGDQPGIVVAFQGFVHGYGRRRRRGSPFDERNLRVPHFRAEGAGVPEAEHVDHIAGTEIHARMVDDLDAGPAILDVRRAGGTGQGDDAPNSRAVPRRIGKGETEELINRLRPHRGRIRTGLQQAHELGRGHVDLNAEDLPPGVEQRPANTLDADAAIGRRQRARVWIVDEQLVTVISPLHPNGIFQCGAAGFHALHDAFGLNPGAVQLAGEQVVEGDRRRQRAWEMRRSVPPKPRK